METFIIPEELDGERIDMALFQIKKAYSRSFVQKLIRQGLVRIDGKKAKKGNRVSQGDTVNVLKQVLQPSKFKEYPLPIPILFEDEDLLVVNKPPGLLTHPTSKEREKSLVNALLFHCKNRLSGIGGELRPGIVHRLDKDTSGLLIVAKHDESHKDLAKQFQKRTVEKYYLALVQGLIQNKHGIIEAPLVKRRIEKNIKNVISDQVNAKHSITHFTVEKTFMDTYSLLRIRLVTGRMHQIRVHLSAIGHPVVGDKLYGSGDLFHRQFLHAHEISFLHPRTQEKMCFKAELPEDLSRFLQSITPKAVA